MSLRFADTEILRYTIRGWQELPLNTKIYLYYLSEATLRGRDILYAQHHRQGLAVRYLLESIHLHCSHIGSPQEQAQLLEYLRRVWFCSGIHHHYSEEKMVPAFSGSYLTLAYNALPHRCRLRGRELGIENAAALVSLLLDPTNSPVRRATGEPNSLLERSSVNFYSPDISTQEALTYYAEKSFSPGLNSRLERNTKGQLTEAVATTQGLYGPALTQVVEALRKAQSYAPTPQAANLLELLCNYYETGDLETFRTYCVEWVTYQDPRGIDMIHGFIETYTDPLGLKGSWESILHMQDPTGVERDKVIASSASEMERKSPFDEAYKKGNITGISAATVQVLMLGGDAYPASPLGVNLPNDEGIRAVYGSKSVSLSNIANAIDEARANSGLLDAFYHQPHVKERLRKYGAIADEVHTALHECLGHGSGKLLSGVSGEDLKEYASTIEETRADLAALYHMADPFWVEKGVLPSHDAYKAAYDRYLTNGYLIQLARVPKGKKITQAHMQNRALIARYLLEHPQAKGVAEVVKHNGLTYIEIHNYERLNQLIGELLALVQHIKSTGDYKQAAQLVQRYGTNVEPNLWQEANQRYNSLGLSPFIGFLNPKLSPVYDANGSITDVLLDQHETYDEQMLRYSHDYGFLVQPGNPQDKEWANTLRTIRKALTQNMDGQVAHDMRENGLEYNLNYGVHLPRLKEIAQTLPKEDKLANYLYNQPVREFRLLACLLMPPEQITPKQALQWLETSRPLEITEQLVVQLLCRTPWIEELVLNLLHTLLPVTSPLRVAPYMAMGRLLRASDLGYELRQPLLQRATTDLQENNPLLHLYALRCLQTLAERDEKGRQQLSCWIQQLLPQYQQHAVVTELKSVLQDLQEN